MILTTDEPFFSHISALKGVSFTNDLESHPGTGVKGLVVRLGTKVDKSILTHFAELKFVATITTGLDHIDQVECEKRGVQILSLKGEWDFLKTIHATPEHTWALLMALTRYLRPAMNEVLSGNWSREGLFGHELSGKTLGIIGFGRVGKRLATYGAAFEMKILAHDLAPAQGENLVDLNTLLSESDYVVCCLPLEASTKGFVSASAFQTMGKGKKPFFINTSRGALVQEEALLMALEQGWIRGAALDVLDGEVSFVENDCSHHPVVAYARDHENLILTPHIAGSTHESLVKTARFIEKKVLSFLGNPL